MSTSKAHILATIRRGLKRGPQSGEQRETLQARLANPPRNLIPARSAGDADARAALFIEMAREASAEIIELADFSALPAAVQGLMGDADARQLVIADTPALKALDWSACEGIELLHRVALSGDAFSLTESFAGIAETGTLMLHSGPDSPTTLNFLPDVHLVTLRRSRIVGPYEDAWQLLREETQGLPRTVNMITGPSRSADIEQRLQMGAHGPKRLVILLIDA